MFPVNRITVILLLVYATTLGPRPTDAQTTVVLSTDVGAVFDAVIDGFPNLAPFDGRPDFPTGYQTLSIGLQRPITEERGIGEFPLGPLAGVNGDAIVRATLTFNIDDVLNSFGPGTGFSGAASGEILVHLYAGNGTVEIADFLAISRPPHTVDTRPLGRITDQTLAQSGPLRFDIDVTEDARALLELDPAAIGVVWRTTDSPTGTSLDHLGQDSAGPPGVNGSFLPFLTIELAAAESPTPTPTVTPDPPTATPTATPTPTATSDPPTPTASVTATAVPTMPPTATATATPVMTPLCAGDCNGDGAVTVDEIVRGVTMALGAPEPTCGAMDADADGLVTITDLVRAVAVALSGC